MGQHSSSGRPGRHRPAGRHRPKNPPRHRAPALPALFATRSRSALSITALSATLAAGVGIAGVAASAAPTGPTAADSGPPTPAHAPATPPIVRPVDGEAPGETHPGPETATDHHKPSASSVRRKTRPQPTVTWVHPLPAARVTSCFGERWGRLHAGVDLAAPHGTPVVAAGTGVVVSAGPHGGYGNAILIDHGNGYLTHYGHLSRIGVEAGQKVTVGQQIGDEGSTGHSTGPHLHFEVHEGHFKNPLEPTGWMRGHGVEISGCA